MVIKRARGRTPGAASAKGVDVTNTIRVRGGLAFAPLTERHLDPADATVVCGVRILGSSTPTDIINVYH